MTAAEIRERIGISLQETRLSDKLTVRETVTLFRSFYRSGIEPGYRMGAHNDINWCMANQNTMYHCTVAVAVGIAGAS